MTARHNHPREDHGFFGPDSVTWRIWAHPATYIGFQRAVTIETLDPDLTAAVVKMQGVYTNPQRRVERTARYFLTIAFGDGRSAVAASDRLHRTHAAVTGTEPVTGGTFSANDPDSQLWIHMTAWHSVLYCYERFGPGRLTPEDEDRYWNECAIAAEMQTIDPVAVPRSRAAVRAYFESRRPRCALSAEGHDLLHYFLRPAYRSDAPLITSTWRATSYSTIATLPRWIRRLAGVRQSRPFDWVTIRMTRLTMRVLAPRPMWFGAMRRLLPIAVPVLEEALYGPPPLDPRVVTPAEARAARDRRVELSS